MRRVLNAWMVNQAIADQLGIALCLGGILKLLYLRNFDPLLAAVLALVVVDLLVLGRAVLGTRNLHHYPKSIGMWPALTIAVFASVLLLAPLGDLGCVPIAAVGIVVMIGPRVGSLTR